MSVNIEMNLKDSDGNYEAIYPKTLGSLVEGKVASASIADNATTSASCSGNSATATKLATARSIRTNLASTSAVNFDGSSAITPGVTGVLGVSNGGTGVNSLDNLKSSLNYKNSLIAVSGQWIGNGATNFTWLIPTLDGLPYGNNVADIFNNNILLTEDYYSMDYVSYSGVQSMPIMTKILNCNLGYYTTDTSGAQSLMFTYSNGKSVGSPSYQYYSPNSDYRIRVNTSFNVSGVTYFFKLTFLRLT